MFLLQNVALHSAKYFLQVASLDKPVVFGSTIIKLLKCKGDWFFYVLDDVLKTFSPATQHFCQGSYRSFYVFLDFTVACSTS